MHRYDRGKNNYQTYNPHRLLNRHLTIHPLQSPAAPGALKMPRGFAFREIILVNSLSVNPPPYVDSQTNKSR